MPIPVSGTKTVKNVVILACFNDHWDTVNNTVLASKGRVNVSEYEALFNEVGHTADGAHGSVKDYYREVSYGKLTVDSIVTQWVRLPQDETYYGAVFMGDGYKQMAADAIAAADAAGFNFSQADSDGDGWVDGLTIIHSGHGREVVGNPESLIWSHMGTMSSSVTKDGVKMSRYHTSPALRGSTTSTAIIRIGVICHEMGHFFGLPDLYDYAGTYTGIGVGNWCIMSRGSWGGSDGKRPTHFNAWSKQMLGFSAPQLVHSQAALTVPDVTTSDTIYMIRDGFSNTDEYFLVENRNQTGFDASTPGKGIMIWHIDPRSANNHSTAWPHPVVKMEDADGNTTANEASSAWYLGNSSMLAGGFRDQTGNYNTSAMRYQAGSYAERTDNAADYTYIRLNNFSAPGATMTVDVSTLIPTVANQLANSPDYTVTWSAASDASKYEIQEGQKTTATSFAEGFEDDVSLYENWIMAGSKRSSNGKRSGTYSMLFSAYDGASPWNSGQSLRSRNTFELTASTAVRFYYMCNTASGSGQFMFQVSNDNGATWTTLWSHAGGSVQTWTAANITAANLTEAGFSVGDDLRFNFVMNTEQYSGWNVYPNFGWAIDDFTVSHTSIPSYTGWTTLDDNVSSPSYRITGKANGTYAYRVRGYANSAWQRFSPAAEVLVAIAPGNLAVTEGGLASSGPYGGPFAPSAKAYTLENTGGTTINWTAAKSRNWVTLSATGGTLAAGASTTVTVSINSNADALDTGNYSDIVSFTNTTNGDGNTTRDVSLNVTQAMPTVSEWPTAGPILWGEALSASELTGGSASVEGDFAFTNPDTVPTEGGSYSAAVTFTPTGSINYTTVEGVVDIVVSALSSIPFTEDFETLTLGDLNGQNNWRASGATVQATVVYAGEQAAEIAGGDGTILQEFAGAETNVWTDFTIQPAFFSGELDASANEGTSILYFNTSGHPVVYDGTNAIVLTDVQIEAGNWIRVTVNSDYVAKKWDLYINSSLAVEGLGFYNTAVTHYERFNVSGGGTTGALLDEIEIGTGSPLGDLTLLYTAGPGGYLEGIATQAIAHGQDGSPVTAMANDGAVFDRWSDHVSTPTRTDEAVKKTVAATALFRSIGGAPIDWYVEYGHVPGDGETWAHVDRRDPFGKGMTLRDEYIADTNPADPFSLFRVIAVEWGTPALLMIAPSSAHRVYTLQVRVCLEAGEWLDVPDRVDVPGGSGALTFDRVEFPAYYRVLVREP